MSLEIESLENKSVNLPRGFKLSSIYGVIIRKREFGEGHRIFTLIEQSRGKFEVTGFGVAKEKSRRRSALLVGNLVSGTVFQKTPDHSASLTEVTVKSEFEGIRSRLDKIALLFLIFEVLNIVLIIEHPFPLFNLLVEVMERMNRYPTVEKYALFFLIRTLIGEGIFPSFTHHFKNEFTQFKKEDLSIGDGTLRFIRDCERETGLRFLERITISQSVIDELIKLISVIVRYHFDRNLKSLDLIYGMRNKKYRA